MIRYFFTHIEKNNIRLSSPGEGIFLFISHLYFIFYLSTIKSGGRNIYIYIKSSLKSDFAFRHFQKDIFTQSAILVFKYRKHVLDAAIAKSFLNQQRHYNLPEISKPNSS